MKSYKDIVEALKGNQHKIDKNKNGKIDAHDFKLLRKEESELEESMVDSWKKVQSMDKGSVTGDKNEIKKRLAYLNAVHDHHKKFGNDTKKVKNEIEKINRSHIAEAEAEQIDELSRDTLLSYANKVSLDSQKHSKDPTRRSAEKANRSVAGYAKAHNRLEKPVKEEADQEERVSRSDYKVSPSGRKSHKEIVFTNGEDDEKKEKLAEVAPPGFEGTVKAMKKKKEIDNPYALAWSMYKKGYKSHKNTDGTMKEEAELDEATDKVTQRRVLAQKQKLARASTAKEAEQYRALKHKQKLAQAKRMSEEVELDEGVKTGNEGRGYHGEHPSETADAAYSKAHSMVKQVAGEAGHMKDVKNPNVMVKHYLDSVHGRHLKGNENAEYIKKDFGKFKKTYNPNLHEESEQIDENSEIAIHKIKVGSHVILHPTVRGGPTERGKIVGKDKEDVHVEYSDMLGGKRVKVLHHSFVKGFVKEEVEHITEGMMTTHEDPLVTVHDKHGLHTHANLSVANNIFGTKVKHTDVHAGAVNTKSRDGTALKFAISQHHAQAVKDEEKFKKQFGEEKVSYKEFMEAMTATLVRPGVTRYTGGSYGSAKGAKYGNTDYDKETLDTKDDEADAQQKRGRGRPAGSKSGARGPRIK